MTEYIDPKYEDLVMPTMAFWQWVLVSIHLPLFFVANLSINLIMFSLYVNINRFDPIITMASMTFAVTVGLKQVLMKKNVSKLIFGFVHLYRVLARNVDTFLNPTTHAFFMTSFPRWPPNSRYFNFWLFKTFENISVSHVWYLFWGHITQFIAF